MRVNKAENRIMFDVDGTLVKWFQEFSDGDYDYYGTLVTLKRNEYLCDLLKAYKKRGFYIVVASANGWAWAEEVVTKLGLTEYVDEVCTKFIKYVDDKPADQWMHWVKVGDISQ